MRLGVRLPIAIRHLIIVVVATYGHRIAVINCFFCLDTIINKIVNDAAVDDVLRDRLVLRERAPRHIPFELPQGHILLVNPILPNDSIKLIGGL